MYIMPKLKLYFLNIKKGKQPVRWVLVTDCHYLLSPFLSTNVYTCNIICQILCWDQTVLFVFVKTYNFTSSFQVIFPSLLSLCALQEYDCCEINTLKMSHICINVKPGQLRIMNQSSTSCVYHKLVKKKNKKKNTYQLSLGRSKFHSNSMFWAPLSCYCIISSRSHPDICPAQ